MAVFVPLIPQLFSANITTIHRFGKEAKDHISSIFFFKQLRTEEMKKDEEDSVKRSASCSGTAFYTLHSSCGTF